MGFRLRRRTKGKNGWFNFSWSEKNGLNASISVKAGPFTWNSGNGKSHGSRVFTNLPGVGLYHVTSGATGKRKKAIAKTAAATQPSGYTLPDAYRKPWTPKQIAREKAWQAQHDKWEMDEAISNIVHFISYVALLIGAGYWFGVEAFWVAVALILGYRLWNK